MAWKTLRTFYCIVLRTKKADLNDATNINLIMSGEQLFGRLNQSVLDAELSQRASFLRVSVSTLGNHLLGGRGPVKHI